MHTVWNSRGRVDEVLAKFWEGGYIGVVKFFGGGYTFLVFYCIFINKFCKNFGGRVQLYPPQPPLCISMFTYLSFTIVVCFIFSTHWLAFDNCHQLIERQSRVEKLKKQKLNFVRPNSSVARRWGEGGKGAFYPPHPPLAQLAL
jgi:hypothetical protein